MKSGLRKAFKNLGTPVPQASGFYGIPGLAGYNTDDTYMRAYGTNGTVFAIISLFAEACAGVEWRLYRKQRQDGRVRYTTADKGSDQRVEVVKHPALALWNQPNKFMPGFVFRETMQTQFESCAKAFWVLDRHQSSSMPIGMWPITPSRIEPVPSNTDFIAGWIYTAPNGEAIPLTNDEVVWMRRPDPTNPYGSVGAVQTILATIDSAKYADEYNRNFFLNNAIPGGVLALDGSMREEEFTEISEQFREQHLGVSRAHRVAVLENTKAQFLMTGISQKDMSFVELSVQARDKMREAWRMHKHMLGTADDVNRANAQTAEEIFAAWGMTPRLERVKLTLNHQFLPLYGTLGDEVEFDYVDPVPTNREGDARELLAKAQAALWLVDAAFEPHAVLQVVGLPDMEAGELVQEGDLPPHWVPHQTEQIKKGGTGAGGNSDIEEIKSAYLAMENRLRRMLSNGYQPVDINPLRMKVGV